MEEEKADKLNVPPYEDLNKDYSEEEIKNMINQVIYIDIKSLNNRLKVIEICLKIFWENNILVKEYKTVFEKIKSKKDCELLNVLMDKRNAGDLDIANQILLYYENMPFENKKSYYKHCAIWAYLNKLLNNARGYEKFQEYSKYLED